MRKQFDGLAALVQSKFGFRANNGDLFVFINRKRTMMKVLYYNTLQMVEMFMVYQKNFQMMLEYNMNHVIPHCKMKWMK